jgi:Flp pilus assembly protein TadG
MTAFPIFSFLRRFARQTRGNVTLIFALSALTLIVATGGAIDISRGFSAKSDLQDAADAAVLRAALTYSQGQTAAATAADNAFLSDLHTGSLSNLSYSLAASTSGNITQLTYTATATTTPYFLGLIGIKSQSLKATATAQSQVNPFELVFVLDTTGSMTGTRISNLKTAVGSVLDTLYAMEGNSSNDVKIGVVPFDTQVRMSVNQAYSFADYSNCYSHEQGQYVSTGYYSYTWYPGVDYHACLAVWDAYNAVCNTASSKSSCLSTAQSELYYGVTTSGGRTYYTGIAQAYEKVSNKKYNIYTYTATYYIDGTTHQKIVTAADLQTSSAKNTNSYSTAPSGYTNFPSSYLNSISGSWSGCFTDRSQDYDVSADSPDTTKPDSLYVAASCDTSGLNTAQDMTNNITSVKSFVNGLGTGGNTNITVGLQFGMEMLSPDTPYTNGVDWDDADVDKYIILVTDGANTQNRWSSSSSDIDARTRLACQAAKDQGITLFVVNIIEGNSSLLQSCASQTSYYYNLTSASQLGDAMQNILKSIGKLRLTH